jgi:hypothetical protein
MRCGCQSLVADVGVLKAARVGHRVFCTAEQQNRGNPPAWLASDASFHSGTPLHMRPAARVVARLDAARNRRAAAIARHVQAA